MCCGQLHGENNTKACWSMRYPSQQQPVAASKHAFLTQGLHAAPSASQHASRSPSIPQNLEKL